MQTGTVSRDELIQRFASKTERNDAIRQLVGGLTATELRSIEVDDETLEALGRPSTTQIRLCAGGASRCSITCPTREPPT